MPRSTRSGPPSPIRRSSATSERPAFNRRYSGRLGRLLKDLGAPYGRLEGDEEVDLIQAAGFRLTLWLSVVGRAAELGSLRIPRWLLSTLFRTLRDGYAIGVFEAAPVG